MADLRPTDRELYLARVAAALRMTDPATQEITEELAAHLADARDDLVTAGLTLEQADREALARLGNPEDLADGVRRAHQSRRRLATAIGPALAATIRGLVVGYFFGGGLLTVASILAFAAVSLVFSTLQVSISGYDTGWFGGPIALFVAAYAGHGIPHVVADRTWRRVEDIRVPIGLIGAVFVAIVAWFLIRVPLDVPMVAVLAGAPVAFLVGAATAAERPRRRMSFKAFVGLLAIATAACLAVGLLTARWNTDDGTAGQYVPEMGTSAFEAPVPEWAQPMSASASSFGGPTVELSVAWDTAAGRSAWRDVRAEIWRSGPPDDPRLLDAAPTAIVEPTVAEEWVSATVTLPLATERTWYRVALTGVAPDGQRYVLSEDASVHRVDFVGSAWEWLTSR